MKKTSILKQLLTVDSGMSSMRAATLSVVWTGCLIALVQAGISIYYAYKGITYEVDWYGISSFIAVGFGGKALQRKFEGDTPITKQQPIEQPTNDKKQDDEQVAN